MSFTSTTSAPTSAPVRKQIVRKISIDNEGNIIRQNVAFSADSDLIAATNTFFFMVPLLLTFAVLLVAYPSLFDEPTSLATNITSLATNIQQPPFELPPFPLQRRNDDHVIKFIMGTATTIHALPSTTYLVDMVEKHDVEDVARYILGADADTNRAPQLSPPQLSPPANFIDIVDIVESYEVDHVTRETEEGSFTTETYPYPVVPKPTSTSTSTQPKPRPKRLQNDDNALQAAFDTEFTCQQVVNAGAEQCAEKADNGKTVRFYCPVACKVKTQPKQSQQPRVTATTLATATVISDGDYTKAKFEASFTQCAAVGSGATCAQARDRAHGCACTSESQCAAVAGPGACVGGYCSYQRME